MEADSEHPLARAIVAAAGERGPVPDASGFRAMSGRGVEGVVDGASVAVGGPSMMSERGWETPPALQVTRDWKQRGAAVLYVVRDGEVVGAIEETTETVRDTAVIAGIAIAVVVAVAFIMGRRRGRRNKTLIEVYRV